MKNWLPQDDIPLYFGMDRTLSDKFLNRDLPPIPRPWCRVIARALVRVAVWLDPYSV